ncbi:MAG: hypothetical protein LUD71_02430 [Clostridiales bacterium]|nr:hypothetical protein [Clostridiales bacterium]
MKKKKFYTIPAKIIVIAVLSASSFLAGLAGMRLLQGHWIGMTMPDMARMSDYENSSEAANYLYREGSTILSTLQNESSFCSYGSAYDETDTIDIMNLFAGVDNPDKNPETTYTLAELASFYGTEGIMSYALLWISVTILLSTAVIRLPAASTRLISHRTETLPSAWPVLRRTIRRRRKRKRM